MKRFLAVLALVAVLAGGATAAWAHPRHGDRAARREVLRACRLEVRETNPDADRAGIRSAVRSCLEEAGLVTPLTEEQQARRAAFRECVETARADQGDGDRATIREAVRECVTAG